jgi:hypothetical protein
MFNLDSNTVYIFFIFFIITILIVFVYDEPVTNVKDYHTQPIYRRTREFHNENTYVKDNSFNEYTKDDTYGSQYYVYNQSFIDDLDPVYL